MSSSKRVVVTGASSGIGAATVRLFRSRGWDVVADLTVQADVDALRDHLRETGDVHALVNNAGGAVGTDTVEGGSAEDWAWMYEINVLAVQRVTSALLPLLRAGVPEGGSADVVTVTSIAAHVPYEGGGGYNAAKAAAHAMLGVLRLELAGEPIRVIEIAPGQVRTDEFSLVRFGGDRAKADAVYEGVPGPLSAEDVAEAIVHAVELPPHVNVDLLTLKPVAQAAPHKLTRKPLAVREDLTDRG
jgi:NADP-dependent 3-hydroxy acid dehydrogenase YdfG